MGESVFRIKPQSYIHVLDNNTNVTRVVVGPQTFTRKDHEKIVAGPELMVTVPPRYYCRIENPVVRDDKGELAVGDSGQVKVRHGDEEIRFTQDPFPLYPGEKLKERPRALTVVPVNQALRIRALRDFEDGKTRRVAGDEWLFVGPGTYVPRIEESVVESVSSIIIKDNEALQLRARMDCTDREGKKRVAGEHWLVRQSGAYLPDVCEEVLGTVKATVLTPTTAVHLSATETHTDIFGKRHCAGDQWLVTMDDCETYIPDVSESVVRVVKITTLTNRQFCVVLDPVDSEGKNRLGARVLRKGECSFFLRPGERLERGIQDIYVLAEGEALLLRAVEPLEEGENDNGKGKGKEKEKEKEKKAKTKREPGDRWMIYGPCDFIPPVAVEVVEKRKTIPLDENEGIYVRDINTGKVRAVVGQSYMLMPNEELWRKPLTPEVEELVQKDATRDGAAKGGGGKGARDPTRVVTYRVPHGAVVQVYDYQSKKSRVVFGPDIVLLGPDEHFTTFNLSGGTPKRESQIRTIAIFLGPDFMTDQIEVETADHARLYLKLAYSWRFVVEEGNAEEAQGIFSTPDFVGDLCKKLGAQIRGAVAGSNFEQFHKDSAAIIHRAIFGMSKEDGRANEKVYFEEMRLEVTSVDIQSVEPVEQKTRDSLQKSVQLAIEITTQSQEATARHEAERLEQVAKGRLERQRLEDEGEAEKARKALLELQAQSASVEASGQATAEARAAARAAEIEAQAQVTSARLAAQSAAITAAAELAEHKARQGVELEHAKKVNGVEVRRQREMAEIEAEKFCEIVDAIGADTIRAMAQAGPEMQSKLLASLGLQSVMITDGNAPINLFNTAAGLISHPPSSK